MIMGVSGFIRRFTGYWQLSLRIIITIIKLFSHAVSKIFLGVGCFGFCTIQHLQSYLLYHLFLHLCSPWLLISLFFELILPQLYAIFKLGDDCHYLNLVFMLKLVAGA